MHNNLNNYLKSFFSLQRRTQAAGKLHQEMKFRISSYVSWVSKIMVQKIKEQSNLDYSNHFSTQKFFHVFGGPQVPPWSLVNILHGGVNIMCIVQQTFHAVRPTCCAVQPIYVWQSNFFPFLKFVWKVFQIFQMGKIHFIP